MPTVEQAEVVAIAVRLVTAMLGTLGFALMFKVRPKRLAFATLGGFITWLVYEIVALLIPQIIAAAFASALVMALYSEMMARILRAPAILFLLTGAIPIVPGNGLYQSMRSLLTGDMTLFAVNVRSTMQTLLGIAVGLGVASILVGILLQIINNFRNRASE